ncbi:Similar to kinesin, putative [Talaromyces stipitatus ATCC 10500]; acc. no. XP_002485772 [Pyronema omphalodes CBS 100304]|uniref:Similar to kinesin, putative [Talaromyces stipitatus ATCC 10500] acc. no. XP_002485772 n=1 Tax=Pyronema omphalodes (strain CBS 100304) TaxID=1076935 RepID=U4LMG6_PYROM|nr:Similar to kinesin, putative [Talaromyces stipitatus ATCC 10500]; acc. no. XP_002485772 [Pyronema omphalodes CBS 100304]
MYEEAEKVLKDNLEDRKRVLGEVYRTFKVAQNLGFALLQQEKLEEAEDFFRYALEGQERVLRAGRLQTNRSAFLLGVSLQTQKRSYEAEPHLRRALVVMKGLNGDEESEVLACVSWLRKSVRSQKEESELGFCQRYPYFNGIKPNRRDRMNIYNSLKKAGIIDAAKLDIEGNTLGAVGFGFGVI